MDNEQNAIDSMADAMLGNFGKKEEVREEPKRDRGREYRGRDFGNGTDRTTSRSQPTLHTTHKSKETRDPYVSVYDPSSLPRQGGRDMSKPLPVNPLRDQLERLKADDVDKLAMEPMLKGIEGVLLDELEKQDWMLLGQAEAFMFRQALHDNVRAGLRAFLIKLTMADVMRDRSRPKKKGGAA